MILILNIILFIVGFITIGKAFGTKTIYASFLLTGIIYIVDTYIKIGQPLVDDLFVNLIVGILIQGIGLGIVLNQDASEGGTDIIAKMLIKFFHIEIGKALLMADFVVVSLAAYTFGIELAIYAFLGIVMNGFMSEKEIVTSIMDKKEYIRLKTYIKSIYSEAFVMVSNVREVLGEGFYR